MVSPSPQSGANSSANHTHDQPHVHEREIRPMSGGLTLVILLVLMFGGLFGTIGFGAMAAMDSGDTSSIVEAESNLRVARENYDIAIRLGENEAIANQLRGEVQRLEGVLADLTTAPTDGNESSSGIMVLMAVFSGLVGLGSFICLFGCFTVAPNEARVLQFFGRYVGTVKVNGLRWANPFYTKSAISLRIRNFESDKLKVNDHDGSPIEIAAVVVWRVVDTAEAMFEVDNYNNYIEVQSEAALRNLATQYPYDSHEGKGWSLRANASEIAAELQREVQERLDKAGIEVLEARISHLAYAPEIAAAMLRRQQASAVIAARQKIVEGAVGMVEHALAMLDEKDVVELDADRRAAMVSNLLVVLCSDHDATPIINAGTIH